MKDCCNDGCRENSVVLMVASIIIIAVQTAVVLRMLLRGLLLL